MLGLWSVKIVSRRQWMVVARDGRELGEIVGDKNKMDFSIEKKIRKEKRNRKRVKRI